MYCKAIATYLETCGTSSHELLTAGDEESMDRLVVSVWLFFLHQHGHNAI